MSENKKETPEEILKAYNSERKIYEEIGKMGIEAYVRSLPDMEKAFEKDFKMQAGCIDEGMSGSIEAHLAGSGILLSEEEFDKFIKQARIKTVTSHDNCGAAGLYASKNGLDENQSDQIYKDWAKKMAEKYGLGYIHITAKEMVRPKEGHLAGACYCDFTGKFTNWDQVDGLPAGFIVSRKQVGEKCALEDVKLSMVIAFGDHGLGNLLTEENPFLLVAVADNQEQLKKSMEELGKIEHDFGERVKVVGFLANEEK